MSAQPQVTNASAFQKKSLGKQVLFTVITLGFYPLYWFYSTMDQLDKGTNQDLNALVYTLLLFIPVVNFLSMWKLSNAAEAVSDQSGMIMFLLFIFFAPLSWYWIQSGINSVAPQ